MRRRKRAMRKRIRLDASILVGSVAAVLIVAELAFGFSQLGWGRNLGVDYQIYMDATTRWLSGGSYFLPRQLVGPYQLQMGDVFYPPVALWLFVPFTLLPAVLWWAVPIAITAAALKHLRPPSWTIAVSLVVFLCPKYLEFVFDGNPGMYLIAALAAAAAWGTPASLVLFKPSLFPLALFGMRSRGWWYGLAALAVLTLPFLPLTLTWVPVVLDVQPGGLTYSLLDLPVSALPLLWWAGSTRGPIGRRQGRLRSSESGLRIPSHRPRAAMPIQSMGQHSTRRGVIGPRCNPAGPSPLSTTFEPSVAQSVEHPIRA